ncbi:hypothetical protein I545_6729 [Mycobacterium kansasii 662]|uniref:Uncharacterized protein n=1 Tax=Mycobacterium kansasii 662 TaxID=1299326 RepID=X7XXB2_MYCKA|nr:hypothetical protein I545_6729 [Mycobacterium kansasii 662]
MARLGRLVGVLPAVVHGSRSRPKRCPLGLVGVHVPLV